jgi:aspartate/methionine/tyrosine aminotransferase
LTYLLITQKVNVKICPFDPTNLLPQWDTLEQLIAESKMVVLTSPNNPSGLVWSKGDIERLVELCKKYNIWLVADQTYYEFLHDDAGITHSFTHTFIHLHTRL